MNMHTFVQPEPGKDHLFWVDDRFFADEALVKRRIEREQERPPIMGVDWVDLVKQDSTEDLDDLEGEVFEYTLYAIDLKKVCSELGVGFSVSSFTFLNRNSHLLEPNDHVFLLDVANVIDEEYAMTTYGAEFANKHKLDGGPAGRFRLFSRRKGKEQLKLVASILKVTFEELWNPNSWHYITVDQGATQTKVKEWLVARLNRDDPVAQAVRFYASPWREPQAWPGKWNAYAPPGNHINDHYGQKLAEWLGEPVSTFGQDAFTAASKCLFIWMESHWQWQLAGDSPGDANRMAPQSSGYPINGEILKAVLRRLKISVKGLSDEDDYRLPLNPALPFLLALRRFAAGVNGETPIIEWHRNVNLDNVATQRISIRCSQVDWGLRDAFLGEETAGRINEHCTRLEGLLHGCVDISDISFDTKATQPPVETLKADADAKKDEWKIIFQGVRKGELPIRVCGVSFTPGWVHLFWTNAA